MAVIYYLSCLPTTNGNTNLDKSTNSLTAGTFKSAVYLYHLKLGFASFTRKTHSCDLIDTPHCENLSKRELFIMNHHNKIFSVTLNEHYS